jgi:BirA family biotin operon repressor/biotin-[acetyl-CoA-carboxylase] ligase
VSLPLIRLAEVDSTQGFLRRHPELGFCGVMADAQTEGRGRQGNAWISEPGAGLFLSAALPVPDLAPGLLLQKAMAAVIAALPSCGLGLKWPNDLLGRHQGRLVKLGGILGERAGERLILGLGVNLRAAPALPDRAFQAACLGDLLDEPPAAEALALAVLAAWTHLAEAPEPAFRWPAEGEPISWEAGQGVCLGWEPDGRLKVAGAAGLERLSAADVRGLH